MGATEAERSVAIKNPYKVLKTFPSTESFLQQKGKSGKNNIVKFFPSDFLLRITTLNTILNTILE